MNDDIQQKIAEFRGRMTRGERISPSEIEELRKELRLPTPDFGIHEDSPGDLRNHRHAAIDSPPTPSVDFTRLLSLIGIGLTVWASLSYRPFDPNLTLMQQPHWWLLAAIYLLNPRALALYYIIAAQPSVAHWGQSLILGGLLMPGGWGGYLLPGLSSPYRIRLIFGLVGSLFFDVLLRPTLKYRKIASTAKVESKVLHTLHALFVIMPVIYAVIGWIWISAIQDVAHKTREEVAHEAGYESYDRMKEYLTGPCLHFWNGVVMQESKFGYMTSENLIPLRAIAGRPNVSLFESYNAVNLRGVTGAVDTMKPWYPYFVFQRRDNGLLVGTSLRTPEEERRWSPIGLCFCWTTRECLNLEREVLTFETLEDARSARNGKPYVYRFADHFITNPSKKDVATYRMAALPVIDRADTVYWRVAKPEGDAGGYETCWVKWDGGGNIIVLRFRTTREEYTRYINGLWQLRRNIREREGEFLGKAVDWVTAAELSDHSDHSTTRKRLEGVPLIGGAWLRPPESIEELEALKKRLDTALKVDSSEALWDCIETAYLTPELVY